MAKRARAKVKTTVKPKRNIKNTMIDKAVTVKAEIKTKK